MDEVDWEQEKMAMELRRTVLEDYEYWANKAEEWRVYAEAVYDSPERYETLTGMAEMCERMAALAHQAAARRRRVMSRPSVNPVVNPNSVTQLHSRKKIG